MAPSAIPPMPPADSVPEFETRRTFYKIDNRVCSILAAIWPIIAPTIDRSIKEVIDGVLELPIGERVAPHLLGIVAGQDAGPRRPAPGGVVKLGEP